MSPLDLESIFKDLSSEIGFFPVKTKLIVVSKERWHYFCQSNAWKPNHHGAFSTRTLTAYIEEGNEFEALNTIHEFFGHGLFFEYHPLGKFLRKNGQRGNRTIKKDLHDKSEYLPELFAIWCELYYGALVGLEDQLKRKYCSDTNAPLKEDLRELENVKDKFGLFGMFAALGFPKYYDGAKIKTLMQEIYGKERVDACKLGSLYGSRKPYSDIDLFVMSRDIRNFNNHWLDIFTKTLGAFERELTLFAVSLRDPLLKGELIFGDEEYFRRAKERWLYGPITEEAIKFNVTRHLDLKQKLNGLPFNSKEYWITRKYSETYLQNALHLKQGKRF